MTGSDYDAPRRSALEEQNAEIESLDAVRVAKAQAQSPVVDLEEVDAGDSMELSDIDDVLGEELTMPIVPRRADEFTCSVCFLVQHRSRVGSGPGARLVCVDCF